MKYQNEKGLALMLALATLCCASCGTKEPEEISAPEKEGQVYQYQESSSMIEWDKPGFILYEDGTFTFYFSAISSYFGCGTYEIAGETLVLKTDDGNYEYCFTETTDGGAYVFDREHSSKFTHFADIPDGAIFR